MYKYLLFLLMLAWTNEGVTQNVTICFGDPDSDQYWNGFGNYIVDSCNFMLEGGGLASMTTQFFPLETGAALIEFDISTRSLDVSGIALDRAIISFIVTEGEDYSVEYIGDFSEFFSFMAIGEGVIVTISFQNNHPDELHKLSPLTIQAVGGLPVELSSFRGVCRGDQIALDWETQSEFNADAFHVEGSDDGMGWRTLGIVAATGHSNQVKNYQFVDDSPFAGQNYYRLRNVDLDGSFQYSKIISIESCEEDWKIYPNPANSELTIHSDSQHFPCTYQLLNYYGQTIAVGTINTSPMVLDLKQLTSGLYLLVLPQESFNVIKI